MTIDPFTRKRILHFIENHRANHGQLPTLNDLDQNGFNKETVKAAIKAKVIEEFYVTLTNGTVVKGYKPVNPDAF